MFFSSEFISDFYNEPNLTLLIKLLCLNILISPIGSIINILLERDLNFKPLVLVDLYSQIISITLMVFLAYNGNGVFALVFGAITQTFSQALLIQFYRPEKIPFALGLKKIKDILGYSKDVVFAALNAKIGFYAVELVAGKVFNIGLLGQLTRANSTASLFDKFINEALYPVVIPYMAQKNRNKENIISEIKNLTIAHLSIAWPFFIALAFLSDPVINILFGDQWGEASRFLALYCVYRIIHSPIQNLIPTLNRLLKLIGLV